MSRLYAPKESNHAKDAEGGQCLERSIAAADNDRVGDGIGLLSIERGVCAVITCQLGSHLASIFRDSREVPKTHASTVEHLTSRRLPNRPGR